MKKFLLFFVIGVILASSLFIAFVRYTSYSEGYRAGHLMKISKKGVLFKTHEGQMNMGGIVGGAEGDLSTVWDFSVYPNREDILQDIEQAMDGGYRVKLYYEEKYMQLDFFGDTNYFVTKVERVEDGSGGALIQP